MLSNRYGMPTHDENNEPVLVNRMRRGHGPVRLPGNDSSVPQ